MKSGIILNRSLESTLLWALFWVSYSLFSIAMVLHHSFKEKIIYLKTNLQIKALSNNRFRIIGIILLAVIFVSCGHTPTPDTEELGLKGEVRSVREISYEAFGGVDTLVQGDIIISEQNPNCYSAYNRKGYLCELIQYDFENNKKNFWRYHYDQKECRLLSAVFLLGDGKMQDSTSYSYDKRGNLTEFKKYNNQQEIQQRTICRTDKYGNILEKRHFGQDNSLMWYEQYTFQRNLMLKGKVFGEDNKLIKEAIYKYDKQGNMLSVTYFNGEGKFENKQIYHYNKEGVPIVEVQQKAGYTELQLEYVYVFDNKGNWTQRIMLCEGEAYKITKREITYYN